jgi:hypothetical protein
MAALLTSVETLTFSPAFVLTLTAALDFIIFVLPVLCFLFFVLLFFFFCPCPAFVSVALYLAPCVPVFDFKSIFFVLSDNLLK